MFDPQAESNGKAASAHVPAAHVPAEWDLAELIREHHAPLYRYAFRLAGNAADAEDLAQQTFVTAHEKLHQVRNAENVRGWLFTVLRNCFLKSVRRNRPLAAEDVELDLGDIPDPSLGASPIDEASPIDGERLQLALNELPEEFRLVLVMFYFEECTYREIADKLEIPLGTVMSRLSRGKQRLRERLADDDRRDVPDAARHRVPDNTRPENSNARVIPRT